MAIGAVRSASVADRVLSAVYRRFSDHASRDEAANFNSNAYVLPLDDAARDGNAPGNSPAALLGALITQMGGAVSSRAKGSYVNLRV